jgi:error-prone DNA polymerase
MRGTATPRELLKAAKKARMTHLALTESNGLWGFIKFVQTAREYGIAPIAGSNIITPDSDIILLAETQKGYENLSSILSKIHEKADLNISDIPAKYFGGLFVLCGEEKILAVLSKIIPSSRLFVELRPGGLTEKAAHKVAEKFRLEMIVTGDVYFLQPRDAEAHKILRAIEKNSTLSQLSAKEYKDERCYFRSEKEMINLFPNSLEAINNAQYLAERCKTDWSFINTIFPAITLKETRQSNIELRKQTYAGAEIRYKKIDETVKTRIEYELSLITQKGFSPYFLIVADIVKQTRATIGRGSAAASIVSFCLFITQVDPIKYNLQFERFIHPERVDMPDIDVDFAWDERDKIIEYVFKKYSKKRTAMVSNQVFLQPRSAIRETAKVYGLSNEEITALTKRIGYHRKGRDGGLLQWVQNDPRFKNVDLNETLIKVLRQSEKVSGAFRMSSVHSGGVIVVPDDIRKYVPVLQAPKGVQIVEWEKDQVEDSGLLKIDLLGNRSLAVVRDTLRQIGEGSNQYTDYHQIQPVGDPKTEELMKAGRTMGVFYIESPATRQLLQKAGRVDFEHVVIYSSIIRPAANRYIDIMLERIHGKPWRLLHPDLHFLKESYGIMVYEEQVSMTAREIAGFGYAESDYLRKVISRVSLKHLVVQWRQKFIDGARQRGYSIALAQTLWQMIQSFSGYSFCKPHSASYAMLSFTSAYLKAHFPAEFLAAVISNQGGYYSAYAYMSDARRFGITILPPHINLSERAYKGRKDKIRMGFMSIARLQDKAIDNILQARKSGVFTSLNDFAARTAIDFSDAIALTKAGCFDAIEPGLSYKEIAFKAACTWLDKNKSAQTFKAPDNTPLSVEEKRQLEIESFGFPVSRHPLEKYLPVLGGRVKKAADISLYENQTINLAGVYITRKVTATKKEEPMEFVTFEDETDIYECVMFPKVFTEFADLLHWETLFVLRGQVKKSFGVYTVIIEKLASLQQMAEKIKKLAG